MPSVHQKQFGPWVTKSSLAIVTLSLPEVSTESESGKLQMAMEEYFQTANTTTLSELHLSVDAMLLPQRRSMAES